jgi:superfamily II DNA or RNA helicase
MDSSLRPYQQKAKKEIFESWDEVDNVMFQMPTGTGKTRLFTSIIRDVNDYSKLRREPVKILIIAHRTELIDQIDESLTKYKVPHNVIAGGRDRNYKYPVNVASIQTITHPNNLKDAKKLNVQFIIIDEAHHALATTYRKLWKLYPSSKKLGVTATPWRMNHQSFLDLFDKLVLSMPIKEFIKQGFLAPYKYFSLKSDSDIQKTIEDIELDRFGEYKESSMEEKMDIGSIRAQLLDSYLSLAEGKKGIIYAINIVHAKHICEEYKKAGYKAISIDSKTPAAERKELVGKFKKGLIDIIVNVDIFSEGFDCPDIEFIQLARPTRSLVKYLQQVGRGLRPTANKQNCVILDNVGMYSRFGLPDARRHWKYHFLGKNVLEEPKKTISKGTGGHRFVDLSEGTEDMELIQDLNEEVQTTAFTPEIENENFDVFDPTSILEACNYQDDNFIFWFKETKKIYEAYIQDDTYFIVSEIITDSAKRSFHRKRVGKIPMESWMFWQLDREKVDHLKAITHYGANYTVFHYRVLDKDNFRKDKYFDYKGREIVSPAVVEAKFKNAQKEGLLYDYIDIPVTKATFGVELLAKSRQIAINRELKGVTNMIAIFPLLSDFGKKYYDIDNQNLQFSKKNKINNSGYKTLKNYESDTCYICRSDLKSFTVRCKENEIENLYKYDFKGNLIKKGTIALVEEPNPSLSSLSDSDIEKLWHVFDSKATSYKYFWFLSIIQLYNENKQDSILHKQILTRMISNAWRYVFKEESEFPKTDQIPKYLNQILVQYMLDESSKREEVEGQVLYYYERSHLNRFLSPLLRNVPYRFLSPWIPFTSNDDVIVKSNDQNTRCLYSIHDDGISINAIWRDYLIENYNKIIAFIENELRIFLKC